MVCSSCKYSDICPDAFKPISRYCSGDSDIDYDVDEEQDDEEYYD